eukprot:COSAG01_NODE_6444_length_3662_cov_7.491159_6_plen_82_part_00
MWRLFLSRNIETQRPRLARARRARSPLLARARGSFLEHVPPRRPPPRSKPLPAEVEERLYRRRVMSMLGRSPGLTEVHLRF